MKNEKRVLIGWTALTLLVLSAPNLLAQSERGGWQSEAARHGWLLNYREAQERARETKKPLMVVFRCVP